MARALVVATAYTSLLLILGICTFALQSMVVHEWTRWQKCELDCTQLFQHNAQLLSSPICCPVQGQHYGERLRGECLRAREENELTSWQCKTRKFWHDSEVRRVYNMYAESHWMLFGVASITIASFIVSMFVFGIRSMIYGSFQSSNVTVKKEKDESLPILKRLETILNQKEQEKTDVKQTYSIPSYIEYDMHYEKRGKKRQRVPLILKPLLHSSL